MCSGVSNCSCVGKDPRRSHSKLLQEQSVCGIRAMDVPPELEDF